MTASALLRRTLPLVLLLSACGRDLAGPGYVALGTEEAPVDAALRLEPARLSLHPGQRFRVDVLLEEGGALRPAGPGVTLAVDDPAIARVDADGGGEALAPGRTGFTARLGDLEARGELSVAAARLVGLRVEPGRTRLDPGQRAQLRVLAELEDGSALDVTAGRLGTTYLSADPGRLRVDADGVIEALGSGPAQRVLARHGGLEAEVVVELGGAVSLVQLAWRPDAVKLDAGEYVDDLRLVGVFSDGSSRELAVSGEGSSMELAAGGELFTEAPDVAAWDGLGLVGLRPGVTALVARFGGLEARCDVTVGDRPPPLPFFLDVRFPERLAVGDAAPWQALVLLDNGAQVDVTFDPALRYGWDPGRLELAPGRVAALSPGETVVAFEYQGISVERVVRVEASPADTLVQLVFEPARLALALGETAELALVGIAADGTRRVLSLDPSVRYQVDSGRLSLRLGPGLTLAGLAPGPSTVLATLPLASGRALTATLPVEVLEPSPVTLRVDPNPVRLEVGEDETVEVRVVTADGRERGPRGPVGFRTFDPAVASVDAAGEVRGLRRGSTVLEVAAEGLTLRVRVEVRR